MSTLTIQKIGVTKLDTDVIVNAANSGLWEGGGVCGAIFREAGSRELTKACEKYGHCDVGNAVITPGFKLKAKYIIHAVGPQWIDGKHGEPTQLYDAYKNSLELAKENGCHSIGFPLISAGIFGYPKDGAWRKAIRASVNFIDRNPDYDMDIVFAILDDNILKLGNQILKDIVDETGIVLEQKKEEEEISEALDKKAENYFRANLNLLRAIANDKSISDWFKDYNAYQRKTGYEGLIEILDAFFFEMAYKDGIVISNYSEIIQAAKIDTNMIYSPTVEWMSRLSKLQIIACVAYQFRADHFNEGCLYKVSVGEGKLIPYFEEYLSKSSL